MRPGCRVRRARSPRSSAKTKRNSSPTPKCGRGKYRRRGRFVVCSVPSCRGRRSSRGRAGDTRRLSYRRGRRSRRPASRSSASSPTRHVGARVDEHDQAAFGTRGPVVRPPTRRIRGYSRASRLAARRYPSRCRCFVSPRSPTAEFDRDALEAREADGVAVEPVEDRHGRVEDAVEEARQAQRKDDPRMVIESGAHSPGGHEPVPRPFVEPVAGRRRRSRERHRRGRRPA